MQIPTIKAWPREERGSRASRRLRTRGLVPAVLYGRGEPNVLLTVNEGELSRLLGEHSNVLQVDWDEHSDPVQLKEIQFDSLGTDIIHADFGRISLTETIRVAVPVEPHGEAAGVKEGGVQELLLHEIEVECLPYDVPQSIRVEVSGLAIGDDVRVRDLAMPENVSTPEDPDSVVLLVAAPVELLAEEAAEEEALAEPEVIGRPSEEQEEAPEGEGD